MSFAYRQIVKMVSLDEKHWRSCALYSAGHADIMKHKKDVGGESMLTLDMVREAQEALRGIARRTPLDRAPKFW